MNCGRWPKGRLAKIFRSENSALLTDQQSSAVSVAADIVRADGEISDLQAFDAVDIQTLVDDAMLNDAVAVLGTH